MTASDLGIYTCRAVNSVGHTHCSATLSFENRLEARKDVEDGAHFTQLPETALTIDKDQDLVIECKVKGYPRPKGTNWVEMAWNRSLFNNF